MRLLLVMMGTVTVDSPLNVMRVMHEKCACDLMFHYKLDCLVPLIFRRKRGQNVCRESVRIPKIQAEPFGLVIFLILRRDVER